MLALSDKIVYKGCLSADLRAFIVKTRADVTRLITGAGKATTYKP